MKKFLLLSVSLLISSLVCHAERPDTYINAVFSVGDNGMVANQNAVKDNVELSTTGEWDDTAIALESGQQLTVSCNEFKNICTVSITVEEESYLESGAGLSIVAANGDGIESLGDLKCSLSQSFGSNGIVTFIFGNGVRLSEITFEANAYLRVAKVVAQLDAAPIVTNEKLKIYADDVVPFTKMTNSLTYKYHISSDTENILTDIDEFSNDLNNVPEEGITLKGHKDGDYVVYLYAPTASAHRVQHINVSYVATPATSIIDEPSLFENEEYFDLMGRRVEKCVRGLQIVRRGNKSKMVVR